MRRLPPLNSVRAFEAAVRLKSFTAAACELGVTQGAISRQVKVIETFLGIKLFRSAGRGLVPTERASSYALELRAGLDRMGLATEEMIEPVATTVLRVNSIQTFASRWLVPRLPAFQALHPGIDVRIGISGVPIEQLSDPFDIVFRRHNMQFPGYECRPIMDDYCLPVCAPDIVAREPLNSLADLHKHTLLYHNKFTSLWEQWLSLAGIPEDHQPKRLRFENLYMALQAASDGLGLALAPMRLIDGELSRGRLIAPFRAPVVSCQPIEVLYPSLQGGSSRTQAFVSWVFDQARLGPDAARQPSA